MSEGRRRWLRPLKILGSAVLLLVLARVVDWSALADLGHTADLRLLPIVVGIWLVSTAVGAARWRLVLGFLGVEYAWRRCMAGYLVSALYTLIVPGTVGGDAARVARVVADTGMRTGAATSSVLVERISGALSIVGMVLIMTVAAPGTVRVLLAGESSATLRIVGVGLIGAGLVVFLSARRWLPRGQEGFVGSLLEVLDRVSTAQLVAVFTVSLGMFSIRCAAIAVLAHALHLDLSLAAVFTVIPLVVLASILPISLGGLGVREGTAVALFARFGLAAGPAALLGFAIYANQLVSASLGGLLQLAESSRGDAGE